MATPPQAAPATTANGFDTDVLGGLYDTLKEHPQGGRATFFSRSHWEDGTPGVATRLAAYRIDGELCHEGEREHELRTDEYVELGSTDTAPGPGEMMMAALGSCIAATTRAYAAMKGLRLSRAEVEVEGDLNLQGMFGLDAGARPGMTELRVTMTVAGDGDEEALREVALLGYQFSPVRDSVANGVSTEPDLRIVR